MSTNENWGPYWTMNSGEGFVAVMLFLLIISSPALPAGMLGYYIGEVYFGNNFAKWGLAILFFVLMYLYVIHIKETEGLFSASVVVFIEYLLLDYVTMKMHGRDSLVMMDALRSFIHWGLSLS